MSTSPILQPSRGSVLVVSRADTRACGLETAIVVVTVWTEGGLVWNRTLTQVFSSSPHHCNITDRARGDGGGWVAERGVARLRQHGRHLSLVECELGLARCRGNHVVGVAIHGVMLVRKVVVMVMVVVMVGIGGHVGVRYRPSWEEGVYHVV